MDSLMRLAAIGVVLALAPLACQSRGPSGDPPAGALTDARPALSAPSIRIPAEQLSRVELSKGGAAPTTLSKAADGWRLTAPFSYRANLAAVESIVAVLAGIEVVSVSEGDPAGARKHDLDSGSAIEVKAWVGDRLASHFFVGYSSREQTHVQVAGDPRLLTVAGRCRRIFEKTTDELRDPVITDFTPRQIEGASYSNSWGTLELVAHPSIPGRFVAAGEPLRNFDADRAVKEIGVLAGLRARGFVDTPGKPADTGLFARDTPRATLLLRGEKGPRRVDVWVGARTTDGRLHVRTSESDQVYLVSAHLESSLVPRRSQFERSDELMRELEAHRDKRARPESSHVHSKPAAPPAQVPPEMMSELRALAQSQRDR